MVFQGIQSIIQIYSTPLLYAITLWFCIIGFAVRAAMIVILTRMKGVEIVPASFKLHIMSLFVAYLTAPICAVIMTGFNAILFSDAMRLDLSSNLYIWYSVAIILSLRHFLCLTFLSVSCSTWEKALICADSFTAVFGYFVLIVMHG